MINIDIQNKALKISWIRRLFQDEKTNWRAFIWDQLPSIGIEFWQCNFKGSDIMAKLPKVYNKFWTEVIVFWGDYNFTIPHTKNEILNQYIWFNSNIKIDNNIVYYSKWFKSGIKSVANIVDKNGKFLTLAEIQNKYDIKIDFLTYRGIRSAIPKKWIAILTNMANEQNKEKDLYKIIKLKQMEKPTKIVYSTFIKQVFQIPIKSFEKWSIELDFDEEPDFWDNACNMILQNSSNTQMRNFQIKYLNRALVTNKLLFKIGISETDKCTFCKIEPEDLSHLFWYCNIVKEFWKQIINWIEMITDTTIQLKTQEILFFCPVYEATYYNMIFAFAKQHIYYCRKRQIKPSLFNFIEYTKKTKTIEYSIAKKNNKLQNYNKRWDFLDQ